MDMSYIGKRIKERRLELGLTQTQIMKETGISSGNMSDIENGKKLPSSSTLCMLSKILDCSVDWILTGECHICENRIILTSNEKVLVENYRRLDVYDQEEIIEIISLKLNKSKAKNEVKSSHSEGSENSSVIA